jgi:hypothetical protein
MDSERISYERTFGKVGSTGDFLQLVIRDPWFAWLHPISELIVAIDEKLDDEKSVTVDAVEAFIKTARALLVATDTGDGFSKHYYEALQRDPDVVMAHGAVAKVFVMQIRNSQTSSGAAGQVRRQKSRPSDS